MKKPNGVELWRGPSEIDGQPIVLIATGLAKGSKNTKTGAMIQTWILGAYQSPTDAVRTGADSSICGDCKHRGTIENGKNIGRSCYVTVFQAPLNIWKSWRRGIYPTGTSLAGHFVRVGSYGDPAAVPSHVWKTALSGTLGNTGYTHQWRTAASAEYAPFVMASVETKEEAEQATGLGYRTFRVTSQDSRMDKRPREVICPASKEAGVKTNCASCKACGGLSAKAKANIVITVHGSAGKMASHNKRMAA